MPDNFDLYGLTDEELAELETLEDPDFDEGGYDPWLLEADFDEL